MYKKLLIFLITLPIFCKTNFSPKSFNLPTPPKLINELSPKNIKSAEKLLNNLVKGPECIVVEKDVLYTCLETGKCIKIINETIVQTVSITSNSDCVNEKIKNFDLCGRPFGIRRFNDSTFVVADSVFGIIAINFEKNTSTVIFSSKELINGKPSKFIDDLDVLNNDTIIFSDASTKYGLSSLLEIFFEHAKDGRVIKLTLSTGKTEVLVNNISFANGVQIHPDKKSVLISESVTPCIYRYYFDGPKKNQHEIFINNLPGFPDNIRLSVDKKSFYVALFATRFEEKFSFFDIVAPHKNLKNFLKQESDKRHNKDIINLFLYSDNNYGIIVELNLNGKIINSYHDSNTKTIRTISTVVDDGENNLYLGSYYNNFIGRIKKH